MEEQSFSVLSVQALIGYGLLLIGVVGAVVSIVHNILNASCARERLYLAKASLGMAVALVSLLLLMYYSPAPWRYIVLVVYLLGMPVLIYRVSIRRQTIREEAVETGECEGGNDEG